MTDIIAQARSVLDGVTEGPWRALSNNEVWRDGFGDLGLSVFDRAAMAEATFITRMGRRHCTGEAAANARFIAAARELVPALLARAEAAEARADVAERDLKTVLDREAESYRRHEAKLDAAEKARNARLVEALTFYRHGFRRETRRSKTGLVLSVDYKPTEALLDDCGNRAIDALEALTQKDRTDE